MAISQIAIAEEPISGLRAVCISPSGNIRIAMAGVSGRMPAIGITPDNVASGISCNVFTAGDVQAVAGLVDFSGYIGLPIYVGRSGQIVTASGAWNSGGFQSGDILQYIGVPGNSGAFFIDVSAPYISGAGGGGGSLTSGSVNWTNFASGVPCVIFSGTAPSSPIVGEFWLDTSTSGSFVLTSGLITSGYIGDTSVFSGTIGSGQVGQTHLASGVLNYDPGICEIRLSLDAVNAVSTNDIVATTTSSGIVTSGTTKLTFSSGIIQNLSVGMLVVSSGFVHGTAISTISGFTALDTTNAATMATSGASIQFIPSVYAVGYIGNRVSLYDGNKWVVYPFTSGRNSSIKTYDHTQSGITRSGDTHLSGLTDTFQLIPGMQVIVSGLINSGTFISTIDSATSVTLNAVAASGGSASVLFALPASGGLASGVSWDVFGTLRSGVPWLQFSNQWVSGNTRQDPLFSQDGMLTNSGAIN